MAPHAGNYLDNIEPATGLAYSLIPDSDAQDIDMAVAAAKAAPVPNAKPKRQSRGKKKKENNNYEGRQLQEALVANIESRKPQRRNSKNSANSNNELAKAIQMSLFNV